MEYTAYDYHAGKVEVAAFEVEKGRSEYHLMVHVTDTRMGFSEQLKTLLEAYRETKGRLPGAVPVYERYFLSDAANQEKFLTASADAGSDCPRSFVEQPPLDGSKVALWAYLQTNVEMTQCREEGCAGSHYEVRHGKHCQYWSSGIMHQAAHAFGQMQKNLGNYAGALQRRGGSLADNCLRTWIFVRDVDRDYAGMVEARNEVFALNGLTEDSHYIASTGIGGKHSAGAALVTMDAFAIEGLKPSQIKYLYAPLHMSRTSEYGVSFERGTAVDFDGRRLVLISGTASIDRHGKVLHPMDVRSQAERMLENVEALLKEAGLGFEDVGYVIVYLRDLTDYPIVKEMFDKRFPDIPRVITLAAVCRPEWLVEMECMAVKQGFLRRG